MKYPMVLLAACALPCTASAATTLHVPADYPTIAAAAAVALDGDIILLADGTYSASADKTLALNQAVTVVSEDGATSAVIDFAGAGPSKALAGFSNRDERGAAHR